MLIKIKNFFLSNYSFFIPLVIFLSSVVIIAPWGNYPVNDDWQFYTHVRYFTEGSFMKNPLIDASFILQGFIALGFTQIFGLSFTALRVLTIIFTILFFLGFYKILKYLNINPKLILLVFLGLLIEPFILTSALSFMTEIYFLTFMIWSLYYFLKFIDNNSEEKSKNIYFILAIIIGSLSILIRQFGVVLLLGYLISILYTFRFNKKSLVYIFITLLLFLSSIYLNLSFPQYSGAYNSKEQKMLQLFADVNDLGEKLSYYPKYLIYFAFFTAPILIGLKTSFKKIYLILSSFVLAYFIFSIDIFDLKNVFHLECYYCESNFFHEHSLLDNIPFKFALSFFLSFVILKTLIVIYEGKIFGKIKIDSKNFTLTILSLGMLLIILAVDSFYDRYFINFDVLILILIANILNQNFIPNYISYVTSFILYLIIFLLNLDFHNSMYYKWNQAMDIYQKTDKRLKAQILVSGTFSRYMNALEKPPEDLVRPVKFGIQKCYVLRHIKKSENFFTKVLDHKVFNNRYLTNPTFSNKTNINEIPDTEENLNKTIFVNEYHSPIYNLIGAKTYIISFCTDQVTERFNIQTFDSSYLK